MKARAVMHDSNGRNTVFVNGGKNRRPFVFQQRFPKRRKPFLSSAVTLETDINGADPDNVEDITRDPK